MCSKKRAQAAILLVVVMLSFTAWARMTPVSIGGGATVDGGGGGIDLTLEYAVINGEYRTNTTISKPANTADGDFLLATIHLVTTQYSITPPEGWTSIASITHSESSRGKLEIFYKRASDEGASWTWVHEYAPSNGFVKRMTGVISSGSPEDVAESIVETGFGTSPVVNSSITTATSSAAVIQIAGFEANGITITSHALTSRITVNGGSITSPLIMDSDLQVSAGATGTKSISYSDYSRALAILIALKPQ